MLKSEFENMVGYKVEENTYKIVEECYMFFDDIFPTKQAVGEYFKKHDLQGFENLRREKTKIEVIMRELRITQEKLEKLEKVSNQISKIIEGRA